MVFNIFNKGILFSIDLSTVVRLGVSLSIPLATVATQFLERSGIAKSTLRSYELTLMPLLQEYGRCPIEILGRQTLEEYLNGLTHLSYTTHHRHQAIVQALFNFAVEKGYLQANPIARLRRRKPFCKTWGSMRQIS